MTVCGVQAGAARRARKPGSIVVKLLLATVAFALVAELGSAVLISHFAADGAHRTFEKRLEAFVEVRNELIGALVWRLQYDELDRILRGMVMDPSVQSVKVYDDAGTLVGSAGEQNDDPGGVLDHQAQLRYVNQNVKSVAGQIVVRASLEPIMAERRAQMLYASLVAVVSVIAIGIAFWIALRLLVTRPLSILSKAIARTRRGQKGVRAPERPLDEIGIFYQAFNDFMDSQERAVESIQEARDRLHYLATRDDLTGLPNRRYAQADFAARRGAVDVAVHFIDLDRFKAVNDTLGHRAGDTLLRLFAEKLTYAVGDRGRAYRLAGDEFLVLQHGLTSPGDAVALAKAIKTETMGDYSLGATIHQLRISLGIYVAEEGLDEFDDILALADLALADAKRSGRGRIALLNRDIRQKLAEKVWLEREVAQAVANSSFEAYFQPQIDARTRKIVSAECLCRWNHPQRGAVSPAAFMPLIEDMGLSLEHGRIMIALACAAAAALRDHAVSHFRVSLNANAQQVSDPAFWAALTLELARWNLPPSTIEIEITESELIENFEVVNAALSNYRSLGGAIALDDFGTGYSSLAYLAKLPFDTIKIDRSFVRDAAKGDIAQAITRLVIGFARETNTSVVAEGIETLEQEETVLACGVSLLQGFRFGCPMPLGELLAQIGSRAANSEHEFDRRLASA